MRTMDRDSKPTKIESIVDIFVCVAASNFLLIKLMNGTNGSLCCTSARTANRMKLLVFSFLLSESNGLIMCSDNSSGSGDRPLTGESPPGGRGVLTAIVTSLSPSVAS